MNQQERENPECKCFCVLSLWPSAAWGLCESGRSSGWTTESCDFLNIKKLLGFPCREATSQLCFCFVWHFRDRFCFHFYATSSEVIWEVHCWSLVGGDGMLKIHHLILSISKIGVRTSFGLMRLDPVKSLGLLCFLCWLLGQEYTCACLFCTLMQEKPCKCAWPGTASLWKRLAMFPYPLLANLFD